MDNTQLSVYSSSKLKSQSDDMQDELDYIVKSVKNIYETYDQIFNEWKGEKAEQYKTTIENMRKPLNDLCHKIQSSRNRLSLAGSILERYNKG